MKQFNMPNKRGLKAKPMNKDQTELMVSLMFNDKPEFKTAINNLEHFNLLFDPEDKFSDALFFPKAVQQRIDVMELPIRFDGKALMGIMCLTDRIGGAIILLIDALECFAMLSESPENPRVVTFDNLIDMYPWGFYDFDDEEFLTFLDTKVKRVHKYINGELVKDINKGERIPWAEVYE